MKKKQNNNLIDQSSISIKGACEHNLQNIDVNIPRNKLVVITGVSGSGKSSLAFDTIYAEGQRRYVESLSAYARQFLELMEKPDVESIEGLSPSISIEQKTTSRNPRSTVGTVTEIFDYLRLLYARIGTPFSPATGLPITSQSITQMVDSISSLKLGTRLYLLAPLIRGRKGEHKKELTSLIKNGFTRVKVDGIIYSTDEVPSLKKTEKHDIEVVVDRIIINDDLGNRLADSIETVLNLSDGLLITENAVTGIRKTYSSRFSCPVSGFTIEEIEPRLFSFNSPQGACSKCDGLGLEMYFNEELIVPDHDLSLKDGAIAPWNKSQSPYYMQTIESIAKHYQVNMSTPWSKLTIVEKGWFMNGSNGQDISFTYDDGKRKYSLTKPFDGVLSNLERRWRESDSSWLREELMKYQTNRACQKCDGYRLKQEALSVKIDNYHIGQIVDLSIAEAAIWFDNLSSKITKKENEIAERILKELLARLNFLNNVGLNYLTLARPSGTLSGGESQRIRLASQIGSGLTGVVYVLDEPSIGLHQKDNDRLLRTLTRLRDLGNSVIVVEHDEDSILAADHVIDMGLGAGIHGGRIIAEGTPKQIMDTPESITGQYLTRLEEIPTPKNRRKANQGHQLIISGANSNNLKNIEARIPVSTFTCVTGVSGSGKSTLIIDTLYNAASIIINNSRKQAGNYDQIHGIEYFDKIVDIDQSPIGRTPRSNPATYTGAFGPIREWYSGLPESRARGYKPGRFSFNVKGGRCEACQGDGLIKIEMHFLPDVYVQCDECKGQRYNRETLEITYKGKSIANILDMTVDEGSIFFKAVPSIRSKMETLQRVGLGYIHIGQQATTLSGGEAQRVKLAKELSRRATGKTLYILDEPTTGLHFADVKKLLEVLHTLVDAGNTVIVIEHNLEVIKTADWIIDLGPDGGDNGGEIIAEGPPEIIINNDKSYTGQYLKNYI
jgi:excinuclease ABC subunit A